LQQCSAQTEHVVKLLWKGGAAHWPKSRPYAACHYHAVILRIHGFTK
jgi:hypothetical protein